jgi:hypothetical protein
MLALKLSLTPILILAASLASRRWGNAIGGWIVGLPLNSGPVSFFLTLSQGPRFAEQAAAGTLIGTTAQVLLAVAYFWAVEWVGWPLALAAGTVGFFIGGLLLQALALPPLALFVIALVALTAGLAVMPPPEHTCRAASPPRWDMPARIVVATTLVLSVTAAAPALGPRLSGIVASFPVFAVVLGVFAHHGQGKEAARLVVRGLVVGLYGFACFFETINLLLARVPTAEAFGAALLAVTLVQGVSFALMRRRRSDAIARLGEERA